MKVVIEFHRVRAVDNAHAKVGRVNCEVTGAEAAIALAVSLLRSLAMPQEPDIVTISDAEGNIFYRAAVGSGHGVRADLDPLLASAFGRPRAAPSRARRRAEPPGRRSSISPSISTRYSAMTLAFPNKSRSYDEARRRVRFTGHDGVFEVPFSVEIDALTSAADGEAHYLAAFDAASATIHDVARELYGSARRTVYVLKAADFR